MPRTLVFLLSIILLTASTSFGQEPPAAEHEAVSIVLPKGDPAAGRAAFVELKCTTCHPVAGDRVLPAPSSGSQGPKLNTDLASDVGQLATSIVAPSHIISSRISDTVKSQMSGMLSPMGDFSDVMTVRQLADLVAYIKEDFPPMVALRVNASLEGNDLAIAGTTDLPDGTVLTYEVRHDRMPIDHETPEWMLFEEGTATVAGGRFEAAVDASQLDPGLFEVYVAFKTDLPGGAQQPSAVLEAYGQHGEKLVGPNVIVVGDEGRAIQVTRTVER